MRIRLLPVVLAVTVLAAGCGEVVDAGANTAPSTTTSTTIYTSVTAPPVAVEDRAALSAESEAFYAADRAAAEAAHAALYPNAAALQAKADEIVNRYHNDPGLWSVGAVPEDDIVKVRVDSETLYDTLIEEFGDDPELDIRLGPNCSIPLIIPPPPLPPECAP